MKLILILRLLRQVSIKRARLTPNLGVKRASVFNIDLRVDTRSFNNNFPGSIS